MLGLVIYNGGRANILAVRIFLLPSISVSSRASVYYRYMCHESLEDHLIDLVIRSPLVKAAAFRERMTLKGAGLSGAVTSPR